MRSNLHQRHSWHFILLMVQKSSVNHGMIKYQPQLVSWISEPSTVSPFLLSLLSLRASFRKGKLAIQQNPTRKTAADPERRKPCLLQEFHEIPIFFTQKLTPRRRGKRRCDDRRRRPLRRRRFVGLGALEE